jgi:RHS repeat-associated protein
LSATLAITATDRAGNQTTQPFHVIKDTGTPTVTIQVPEVAPLRFWVSWLGQDAASGVRDYDVQYKVGAGGAWVSWLMHTSQTQAPFVGERDQSYYFRVQATDNVNNASAWVEAGPVVVSAVTKYYMFGGQRVAMRQGDVVYYLHSDHLGSSSLTTDQSGAPVAETRYLPYGEERWTNEAQPTDFTFTGQRAERGFGLMDYNARYYDPGLGRFVSADTVVPEAGNPQALNRYAYALGNPLRHPDPSGHAPPKPVPIWKLLLHRFGEGGLKVELPNRSVFGDLTLAVEGDVVPGVELGVGKKLAFNFASGELTLMDSTAVNFTASTPEIGSGNVGVNVGTAKTSTNDMLLGPSRNFAVNVAGDFFVQGGVVYQRSESLQDFWTNPEFWENIWKGDYEEARYLASQTAIDPITSEPVVAESVGFFAGVNAVPNDLEVGGSVSPGLNYGFKDNEINLYPWNWVLDWVKEQR